jgi:hypothetical protein
VAYGETIRLARKAELAAIDRLIQLMYSDDPRVAAVAANAVLDRAFGLPRGFNPEGRGTQREARQMRPSRFTTKGST